MKHPYQKDQRLTKSAAFAGQHPPVKRVKTDGRIGSATPPSMLKGGLNVNNNSKVQPHHGQVGSVAASHMSPSPKGGTWSPRVAKSRKLAGTSRHHEGIEPINHAAPALKKVKPS